MDVYRTLDHAEFAAAVRPWETLSPPIRVSWFVPSSRTQVVSAPAAGKRLGPDGALYASTTAYGLASDPNVPDVHQAIGIGKIVRFTP